MKIQELGYVVVGSTDIGKWRSFATDVLGMMATDAPGGGLYLKMDGRQFRFLIVPSDRDHLFSAAWEVANEEAFDACRASLKKSGVALVDATEDERKIRLVQDFFAFIDPVGNRQEVYWGPISDFNRFISPIGVAGFVTEGIGLGHVVLPAFPAFDQTVEFWTKTAGFELSDMLRVPLGITPNGTSRIFFYHCDNGRQHSLALAEMPSPAGCIHVMVEVASIDEVGRALDRVQQHQVPVLMGLGRHVNDEMISFYMITPGMFALEYGWGGLIKDWTEHQVFETTTPSHWGHRLGG